MKSSYLLLFDTMFRVTIVYNKIFKEVVSNMEIIVSSSQIIDPCCCKFAHMPYGIGL